MLVKKAFDADPKAIWVTNGCPSHREYYTEKKKHGKRRKESTRHP